MFSFFGSSRRNTPLNTTVPTDWSAGTITTNPSSKGEVVVKNTPRNNKNKNSNINSNNKKKESSHFPHSLRLDEDRVAYSSCNLNTIPEDKPLCEYQQVIQGQQPLHNNDKPRSRRILRSRRHRREQAMDSKQQEQLHQLVDQVLRDERTKQQQKTQPQQLRNRNLKSMSAEEFHQFLFPNERNERMEHQDQERKRMLNSEQFHQVLFQVLRDERLQREGQQNDVMTADS